MMPKPASIKVYGINGELLRKTFLNDLFKQILSDVYTGSESCSIRTSTCRPIMIPSTRLSS
ncbi:hypothetical protein BgiBS90_012581, partial [Biomphalaria glabrata]